MKKLSLMILGSLFVLTSCGDKADLVYGDGTTATKLGGTITASNIADQNLLRAMQITDKAVACYFPSNEMAMARYYNPYTQIASTETGSVWMYTSAIESVNAIMLGLKALKDDGRPELYNLNFDRYKTLLQKLYDKIEYYAGTYTLTSYTQTKQWTVYGVNRGSGPNTAAVEGVMNVYDDQMWLIRELVESYKLTGEAAYLTKAEYLTSYVLDGWDCAINPGTGKEYGGITWGPGYVTKHSCSNGPMVSPLVWLYELYQDKTDQVTYGIINADNTRATRTESKKDYYLRFAKAVYDYQKTALLDPSTGLYSDMMGGAATGGGAIEYETVNSVRYRKHTTLNDRVGTIYSYNTGSMISGAADLYRVTADEAYLTDVKSLTDKSFPYFAKMGTITPGYYSYAISGFNNWFNGVMMRGYAETYPAYNAVSTYLDPFQKNLDYGYSNFLNNDLMPTNLLLGWNRDLGKNSTEGMFNFAFASEYAVLARYNVEK